MTFCPALPTRRRDKSLLPTKRVPFSPNGWPMRTILSISEQALSNSHRLTASKLAPNDWAGCS